MEDKNIQKAGNNSNQIQYVGCSFYGITNDDVRMIIKEEAKKVIVSASKVARETVENRIAKFENIFLPQLIESKCIENLKKPEVLLAIREAEQQAIYTDEEKSYKLLSELLANRIEYSNDRLIASSLKRTTEVATEVSDESLTGLSLMFIIEKFRPNAPISVKEGLKKLDTLFAMLDLSKLPKNKNSLDQLDVLGLLRIEYSVGMKKLIDYYIECFSGNLCTGIKRNSEQYNNAVKVLNKAYMSESDLVEHELNKDYVRLPLTSLYNYNEISHIYLGIGRVELTEEQRNAYDLVIKMYEQNELLLNQNKNKFKEIWHEFPNLVKVSEWWDSITVGFEMTNVGKALAFAYVNKFKENTNLCLPKINMVEIIN